MAIFSKFFSSLVQLIKRNKIKFLVTISMLTIIPSSLIGYCFYITPANFQNPKQDHAHFRMQYIFMGQAENFGLPRYQVDYVKDICNGAITESPIHFHDNLDQYVHLHWQKVTGGQVLKFYGLNKIGGLDDYMGVKTNDLASFKFTPLPIHSKSLPQPRAGDKFWVYSGDENSFSARNFDDFVNQELETFFNQKSRVRQQKEEVEEYEKNRKQSYNKFWEHLPNPIFGSISANAHAGEEHKTLTEAQQHEADVKKAELEKIEIDKKNNIATQSQNTTIASSTSASSTITSTQDDQELKEINNLLGNVVIFVQPDEPTNEQVKARFNNLVPLTKSVCGG